MPPPTLSADSLISVVIPLYNKAPAIERAVRSVLSQSMPEIEIVVVDDGSTDGGAEVVRAIGDERVRVVQQANLGVSAARNEGIRRARGRLLAFLDADDEWERDFLETIHSLRARWPSAQVFATAYRIHRGGHVRVAITRGLPPAFEAGLLHPYFVVAARSDPPLCASSVALTREAIESVGGFPEGISAGEDLLTWARLAARFDIAYTRAAKATFWAPASAASRPGRVPQVPDPVAPELRKLADPTSPRCQGLTEYVGLWHAMRGLVFLQIQARSQAVAEMRLAARSAPSARSWLMLLLATLPPRWATFAIRLLRAASGRLRNAG